jgi:hypothetical protein
MVLMSNDQYYEHRIGLTMTDDQGNDIVLVRDQDGDEYVVDLNEEDSRY